MWPEGDPSLEAGDLVAGLRWDGGAAAGDVAARIAAEAIKKQLVGAGPAVARRPDASLKSAVAGANGAVFAEAKAHPETRGMGTTCTAAIVLPDRLFIAQVGDSRAYLLRGRRLELLTRDQTMAEQLVDSGVLRAEDVDTCMYSHVLSQAVGTRSTVKPITSEMRLIRGDRILLCSDGLHGPVSAQEIARILGAAADINQRRPRADSGGAGCGRAGQRDRRRGGLRIAAMTAARDLRRACP